MVLDGKSSEEYLVNAGVPQGSILGPTLFVLCICDIVVYADDTSLYSLHSLRVIRHQICGNN